MTPDIIAANGYERGRVKETGEGDDLYKRGSTKKLRCGVYFKGRIATHIYVYPFVGFD